MSLSQFFIFLTDSVLFILKLILFLIDNLMEVFLNLPNKLRENTFNNLPNKLKENTFNNFNVNEEESLSNKFKQYLVNFDIKNNNHEIIIFKHLQEDFPKERTKHWSIESFITQFLHLILFNQKIFLITFLVLLIIFILTFLFLSFDIALTLVIFVLLVLATILFYPKIKENNKYNGISRDLPFALRHLSTELKSGKGLHDSLNSVVNADYGILSIEFERVLNEIKYGKSTEQSLLDMAGCVKSQGLSRAVQQIIGTLKIGGNLADSLSIIAEDVSFDMRIKLKEYSQKLNGFVMIYTFVAILAPVILLVMMVAASTVMGDFISRDLILILYIFFFPMIVVFMGLFIKKLEPQV